jgi:hypothetical protein
MGMINMFNSKFILFVVGILIVCLILVGYISLSNSFSDSVSDLNESSDDVGYIWMEDENGNIKLTPTTDTYVEGSASAPG